MPRQQHRHEAKVYADWGTCTAPPEISGHLEGSPSLDANDECVRIVSMKYLFSYTPSLCDISCGKWKEECTLCEVLERIPLVKDTQASYIHIGRYAPLISYISL